MDVANRHAYTGCDKNKDLLNIMVVCPFYPSSAQPVAGIFIANQCSELHKLGLRLRVIYPLPRVIWMSHIFVRRWRPIVKTPKRYLWNGIKVVTPRYITLPRNFTHNWAAKQIENQLTKIIIDKEVSIIHAHGTIPVGVAAVKVGQKFGIPVVLTVHGTDINIYPYLSERYMIMIKEGLRLANLVLAVGNNLASKAIEIEPMSNVKVHKIGIDLERFRNPITSSEEKQSERLFRIIFIGRLSSKKGVYDLLHAFNMFVTEQNSRDSELVFVGDGPEASLLRNMCCKSEILARKVRFLGVVMNEKIPELLFSSDVLVLPSYSEGLPMVVLEAMAAGVPCIASRVGGIPELINNGQNGILIEPGSSRQITEALIYLAFNENARKSLGESALMSIQKEYDIQKNTAELVQLYQDVIRT